MDKAGYVRRELVDVVIATNGTIRLRDLQRHMVTWMLKHRVDLFAFYEETGLSVWQFVVKHASTFDEFGEW